ncbi:symmetrical bis(5'-nucleosyl)-tetraphosphatase [Aestuariirhabdus sp. Z084]|uniref:symmetrical bis(5'-nucleosyl)-tetraphosphatase n=1 Tax=Aestuariirhabdus haliotis TaxID=2918751 RepID=UPI00201B3587|nr:symmetrical bis(5'-nucleosyl)-tetraphosphatase [Aestuariirhabdus haliotis]MCL6415412.1 symmetrical bis(5'-nucleosyl)-tetraphosphatase [Aestuariirhabdus haliotis]MCL6419168.1 symmetrical bis(5'-nucleosyl)-tetraphosphatase [Aestuariirhabdus haliotis]
MPTYAIGDIQGCFEQLQDLLALIEFNPKHDRLWVAGDLVNRGPQSLETLRYLRSLGDRCVCVLGNHDLHLLAVAEGIMRNRNQDTLTPILDAPDRDELLQWLRQLPLVHHCPDLGFTMVHAGIPPGWSLKASLNRAAEVESVLRSDNYRKLLKNMYGDEPACWHKNLKGSRRLRVIINYLTRMRFCRQDNTLDLDQKSGANNPPQGFAPWYQHEKRKCADQRIIFGHWAALEGKADHPNVFALDTGCVWGGQLTALTLETGELTSLNCPLPEFR